MFARLSPSTAAFPVKKSGRLLQLFFSRPAQRLLTLWPARSPSRHATLYIESSDSFVASAAASIATGWSEPVPGRVYSRCGPPPFHGAPGFPTNQELVPYPKVDRPEFRQNIYWPRIEIYYKSNISHYGSSALRIVWPICPVSRADQSTRGSSPERWAYIFLD